MQDYGTVLSIARILTDVIMQALPIWIYALD